MWCVLDHLCLPIAYISRIPTLNEDHIGVSDIWNYIRHQNGPLSSNFVEATAFLKTGVISCTQPDLQYHFIPATLPAMNWDNFNTTSQYKEMVLKAVELDDMMI